MRKPQWWALGALLGTLGLVLGLASPAQSLSQPSDSMRSRGSRSIHAAIVA